MLLVTKFTICGNSKPGFLKNISLSTVTFWSISFIKNCREIISLVNKAHKIVTFYEYNYISIMAWIIFTSDAQTFVVHSYNL